MTRLLPCILLLCIVAIWGWTFSLMKGAIAEYGVVSFLAVRFVIASAAMGLFAARKATWRSLRAGGGIGLVLAAAYLFQTNGLAKTTPTNTGLITGLCVVFAPIANRVLFGVRTPGMLWGAIGVSLAGLVLLTVGSGDPVALGDVLTLGCAARFGLHVALLDRHAKHHDASVLTLGQMLTATLVFLAVWPWVNPIAWPSPRVWFALAVTGLLASAAAFWVQTYAQQRLTAVQAAIIIVTEPLFAAGFGYLLAGDRLVAIQWVGAALMVGALVVAEVYPP